MPKILTEEEYQERMQQKKKEILEKYSPETWLMNFHKEMTALETWFIEKIQKRREFDRKQVKKS